MVVVNGKENKCNYEIEIEDSIVIIICGEMDTDRLGNCIKTIADQKVKKLMVSEE
jgi:hypothetical protein